MGSFLPVHNHDLFGHDMQELRAFQVAHVLQRGDKPQHIVTVNRADVVKAQLFKQRAGTTMPLICSSVRLSSSLIGGTPEKTFSRLRAAKSKAYRKAAVPDGY